MQTWNITFVILFLDKDTGRAVNPWNVRFDFEDIEVAFKRFYKPHCQLQLL